MAEWFCEVCRKWNRYACCTGCLQINPSEVRWMSEHEIRRERSRALDKSR